MNTVDLNNAAPAQSAQAATQAAEEAASSNFKPRNALALVTGASGGIGAACCRQLAAAGFTVVVHYNRNRTAAEALVRELEGIVAGRIESAAVHSDDDPAGESLAKLQPLLIGADLATREGCDQIYDAVRAHDLPPGVLVNNAGLVRDNPLFSASLEELGETLQLNVHGTWYLSKRLARLMIRERRGRMINISSVVGSTGNPAQSIYGMSKAAIDNFTKVAAQELAEYGILVNGVAPGFIDTEMTRDLPVEAKERLLDRVPLGRMGRPEEVAEIVTFLATAGSYITGTTIHANGGLYAGA